MEVHHLESQVPVVSGEILGHPLGQGRDQDTLSLFNALADLAQEILDLAGHGFDRDLRVHEARGTDELFHHPAFRFFQLMLRRRRGDVQPLPPIGLKLLKGQRPVVQGRGKAESMLHEGLLARPVPPVHPPQLRDGRVAFVNDHEGVFREVIHEGRRRLAGRSSREVTGIIFYSLAVTHLFHHLNIELRPLIQALSLQEFTRGSQFREPFLQLLPDPVNGPFHIVPRRHIMASGINRRCFKSFYLLPPQRIHERDGLDGIAEKFHPDDPFLLVGWKDLHHVSPHAKGSAVKIDIIARVLHVHKPPQHVVAPELHSAFQTQDQAAVFLRRPDAVNARYAGHDDDVLPFQKGAGRRVPHLIDSLIDGRVLLDVRIRAGDIGLGLIIIVVTHKILYGVAGEERLEFRVKLGCQGLVVGNDKRRPLDPLDHIRNREGLPGTRDTQKDLLRISPFDP